jgi:hypothetical protein
MQVGDDGHPDAGRLRVARVAPLAACLLFAGIGTLGWLAGHVVAYDAAGASHAHDGHAYMGDVVQVGSGILLLSVVLTVAGLALGRASFGTWVRATRTGDDTLAWLGAAMLPATSFLVVEVVEGSAASATGELVLLVGMPLQALLGMFALWLARELLGTIVEVADRLVARPHVRVDGRGALSPCVLVQACARRRAPMASGAPRRGPPLLPA